MSKYFFLSLVFCCSILFAADDGSEGALDVGSMSGVEENGKRILFQCVYTVRFAQHTDLWSGELTWRAINDFSPRIGQYYQHATPMAASFASYIKGLVLASGRDASKPLFLELTGSLNNDIPSLNNGNSGSNLYDGDEIPSIYLNAGSYQNTYTQWRPYYQSISVNNRIDHQIDVKIYQKLEIESLQNGYVSTNNLYRKGVNVFILDGGIWKPAAGAYIHDATGAPRQWFGEVK